MPVIVLTAGDIVTLAVVAGLVVSLIIVVIADKIGEWYRSAKRRE